jgi:hypothetical protein
MSCIRGHDFVIVAFYWMNFINQRLKFKVRMPQSRRGRAAAAAVDAQSSCEDTPEVDARLKQSKTGPKKE